MQMNITFPETAQKYYLKQLGRDAPKKEVSTLNDLKGALESLGTDKPLTFAMDFGMLGHMTISFLGSATKESLRYNPNFDDCVKAIGNFLETTPSIYAASLYAKCKFKHNDVLLVTFDEKVIHKKMQDVSKFGIQEDRTGVRVLHVTTTMFDDTPTEKRVLIEDYNTRLPFCAEEDAIVYVQSTLE